MAKRILLVAPTFWPRDGGAERLLGELAQALISHGHDVCVATPIEGAGAAGKHISEVRAIRLPYGLLLLNPVALWRLIKTYQPDIVQTSGPDPNEFIALLFARMLRRRIVALYHADVGNKMAARAFTRLHKWFLRWCDDIVFTTARVARCVQARTGALKSVHVIPPGISGTFHERLHAKRNDVILFVGRLDAAHMYKRLDLLLSACVRVFEKHPSFRLEIVGDGELRPRYESMASDIGLSQKVRFLGRVSDDELRNQYAKSRVFVLPSSSIQEGFGIVILESMGQGCIPVISSAIGSAEALAEAAVIVEPDNEESLAAGISRAIQRSEVCADSESMYTAAFTRFHWNTIAKAWSEIYR